MAAEKAPLRVSPATTFVCVLALLLTARAIIWSGVQVYRVHQCEVAHGGEASPECLPPLP